MRTPDIYILKTIFANYVKTGSLIPFQSFKFFSLNHQTNCILNYDGFSFISLFKMCFRLLKLIKLL